MELTLRPHHIITLRGFIKPMKLYQSFGFDPRDIIENHSIRNVYNTLYTPETLKVIVNLAYQIMQNPETSIKFTLKEDDPICSSCIHRNGCSRGNFNEIKKGFTQLGMYIKGDNPPVESDRRTIENLSLDLTKIYKASDLFSTY